uniref:CCR4-NOT transcription complex subunit 1 CAF1-binding domain-containing protein n=1 Tax=Ditylenchus dipsaci TaxID=166011 RepID=A0A915E807_9BILA
MHQVFQQVGFLLPFLQRLLQCLMRTVQLSFRGTCSAVIAKSGISSSECSNVDTLVYATKIDGKQIEAPPQVVFERSPLCSIISASPIFEQGIFSLPCVTFVLRWSKTISLSTIACCFLSKNIVWMHIKDETLRNALIILRKLGLWLGTITNRKRRSNFGERVGLKLLLLDASTRPTGSLICSAVRVQTILASGKSTVFKPKCSWIFGIIKVLVNYITSTGSQAESEV